MSAQSIADNFFFCGAHQDRALGVLCGFACGEAAVERPAAAAVVRAEKRFAALQAQWAASGLLVDAAVCHALFALLARGLAACVDVFEQTLAAGGGDGDNSSPVRGCSCAPGQLVCEGLRLRDGCGARERLWAAYLGVFQTAAASQRLPPARLRGLVERALAAFPANPDFHTLFIAGEARFVGGGRRGG